jgi:hypothetical protein
MAIKPRNSVGKYEGRRPLYPRQLDVDGRIIGKWDMKLWSEFKWLVLTTQCKYKLWCVKNVIGM